MQHRHDELFRGVNNTIAKHSGVDIKEVTSLFKDPVGFGDVGYMLLNPDKQFQNPSYMDDSDFSEESEVWKSLPDLDYLSYEEVLENRVQNINQQIDDPKKYADITSKDQYKSAFYDLQGNHLSEFVQRLGYLSDDLGNLQIDETFLFQYMSGKLKYPKSEYQNYRDLIETSAILKPTQKNIKFFMKYGNLQVKGKKDSSVTKA